MHPAARTSQETNEPMRREHEAAPGGVRRCLCLGRRVGRATRSGVIAVAMTLGVVAGVADRAWSQAEMPAEMRADADTLARDAGGAASTTGIANESRPTSGSSESNQPGAMGEPSATAAVVPAGRAEAGRPDASLPLGPRSVVGVPTAAPEKASSVGQVLEIALPLGVVVGLILGASILVRRIASRGGLMAQLGAGGRAPAGVLSVLGRYPAGRGTTLVLLQVDRRVLLVCQTAGKGLGGSTMSTLTEFSEPEDVASILLKTRDAEERSLAKKFEAALRDEDERQSRSMPTRGTPEVATPSGVRAVPAATVPAATAASASAVSASAVSALPVSGARAVRAGASGASEGVRRVEGPAREGPAREGPAAVLEPSLKARLAALRAGKPATGPATAGSTRADQGRGGGA